MPFDAIAVDWMDNVFNALLMMQEEFKKTPHRSMWMSDDHPVAKHQQYLERTENKRKAGKAPKKRRM